MRGGTWQRLSPMQASRGMPKKRRCGQPRGHVPPPCGVGAFRVSCAPGEAHEDHALVRGDSDSCVLWYGEPESSPQSVETLAGVYFISPDGTAVLGRKGRRVLYLLPGSSLWIGSFSSHRVSWRPSGRLPLASPWASRVPSPPLSSFARSSRACYATKVARLICHHGTSNSQPTRKIE